MRATLFHNPTAGGKAFSKKNLLDSLRLAGFKVKYVSTKGRAFKTALKKESGLFVVAGGDGTITKILTGMKNRRVPVAIAPTGSANNIARSLGIHGTPQELVELWRSKHRMRLNIGSAQGMWGRRSFVESAGIGALAKFLQTVEDADGAASLRKGRSTLSKVLRKAEPLDVEIKIDGKGVRGDFLAIEVANTAYTGPGLPIAPKAKPGDGKLDVVLIRRRDRKAAMRWIKAPQKSPPPWLVRRGRSVSLNWRNAPMRLDDKHFEANKDEEQVAVFSLDRFPVEVLKPTGAGEPRLRWRRQERKRR